ncbi:unnamed protein product [Arabidopsis thaliana]|nr:unnamed protein product [Arabidopsis thaliana]
MFEAVRYLPKQLLRRITSAFSTTSTVHLAFIDRPSLSWLTDSSSSSARRDLLMATAAILPPRIGLKIIHVKQFQVCDREGMSYYLGSTTQ